MSKKPELKEATSRRRLKRALHRNTEYLDNVNILENAGSRAYEPTDTMVSRPVLAERSTPPNRGTNPPTSTSVTSGTSAVNGTQGQPAAQAAEVTVTPAAENRIPDSWEDLLEMEATTVTNVANKIACGFDAVVDVGSGGNLRSYGSPQAVHHINPVAIPQDAVRVAFANRRHTQKLKPNHTECKCHFEDCTCYPTDALLVFWHSSYYFTKEKFRSIRSGVPLLIVIEHTPPPNVTQVTLGGTTVRTSDTTSYAHQDASWQLKDCRLPDGRMYCVKVAHKGQHLAVLKSVVSSELADYDSGSLANELRAQDASAQSDDVEVEVDVDSRDDSKQAREYQQFAESICAGLDPKSKASTTESLQRAIHAVMRRFRCSFDEAQTAVDKAFSKLRETQHRIVGRAVNDHLDRVMLGYEEPRGCRAIFDALNFRNPIVQGAVIATPLMAAITHCSSTSVRSKGGMVLNAVVATAIPLATLVAVGAVRRLWWQYRSWSVVCERDQRHLETVC